MFLPKVNCLNYLQPLSWIYGAVVSARNWMYDHHILNSVSFEGKVKTICVGNIAVGGTGKTPHTEYLVRLLQKNNVGPIAVLSRGYRRHTHGFVLANSQSTAAEIGDEPYQILHKFPDITIAVCESRVRGIRKLLSLPKPPKVVILDDAMQHRHLKPGLTICLSSYHRIMYADQLLPAGRLREPIDGVKRADAVVITKCPHMLRSEEKTEIFAKIPVASGQRVFYSSCEQGELVNLATNEVTKLPASSEITMLSGIADPTSLEHYILTKFRLVDKICYPDHYEFKNSDYAKWAEGNRTIITTQKDAARMIDNPNISEDLKKRIYFMSLNIVFQFDQTNRFDTLVMDYINRP